MSELPDGLPNNCLDCITSTWEQHDNGQIKLIVSMNGNTSTMLTTMDILLQPHFRELMKEVEK
jgi:hypothetical protein